MVWKWVPHDLNDILGPYHFRISEKNFNFFLKEFSKENGLFYSKILTNQNIGQQLLTKC